MKAASRAGALKLVKSELAKLSAIAETASGLQTEANADTVAVLRRASVAVASTCIANMEEMCGSTDGVDVVFDVLATNARDDLNADSRAIARKVVHAVVKVDAAGSAMWSLLSKYVRVCLCCCCCSCLFSVS